MAEPTDTDRPNTAMPTKTFVSEDESAGYAHPVLDLAAAAALVALSVWIMIESVALKVPDGIATAPGLLPFITGATLCLMAVVLGVVAWRRRELVNGQWRDDLPPETGRTVLLIAILLVYVSAIEFISFETDFAFAGLLISVGAFEIISVIVLSAIFRVFWTDKLWACLSVSVLWIALLSVVFRTIFKIPMPG